jgi:nucleoid-associated protein YgaU
MTTDAKVGLLLGLVFIFIIAFLINGLPNFLKASSNSEFVRASAADFQKRSVIIGAQTHHAVEDSTVGAPLRVSEPPMGERVVHDFSKQIVEPVSSSEIRRPSSGETKADIKTYIVQPGDNLGKIAKKIYGSELGNKIITVQEIFLTNKQNLKSPDSIIPGQELLIPALPSAQVLMSDEPFFPEDMFERIRNAFPKKDKSKFRQYDVQDGDSLWRIAEKALGDGARYHEIAELNSNTISDIDDLSVGMCLKLPSS